MWSFSFRMMSIASVYIDKMNQERANQISDISGRKVINFTYPWFYSCARSVSRSSFEHLWTSCWSASHQGLSLGRGHTSPRPWGMGFLSGSETISSGSGTASPRTCFFYRALGNLHPNLLFSQMEFWTLKGTCQLFFCQLLVSQQASWSRSNLQQH